MSRLSTVKCNVDSLNISLSMSFVLETVMLTFVIYFGSQMVENILYTFIVQRTIKVRGVKSYFIGLKSYKQI